MQIPGENVPLQNSLHIRRSKMREEFEAPKNWLARFKELSGFTGNCFLKAFRVSKWAVEVQLMESEVCVIAIYHINVRTGIIDKI
jgi:hypothetical protein